MNPDDSIFTKHDLMMKELKEFAKVSGKPLIVSNQQQSPAPPSKAHKNWTTFASPDYSGMYTHFRKGGGTLSTKEPKPEPIEVRNLIMAGTTIYVYNSEDGQKHRQVSTADFFFHSADIIQSDADTNTFRITLDKGVWKWMEVDQLDVQAVHIFPKKSPKKIEPDDTERIVTEETLEEEEHVAWSSALENEMAEVLTKEIDAEILKQISKQIEDNKKKTFKERFIDYIK
jgi:hypothetical protein